LNDRGNRRRCASPKNWKNGLEGSKAGGNKTRKKLLLPDGYDREKREKGIGSSKKGRALELVEAMGLWITKVRVRPLWEKKALRQKGGVLELRERASCVVVRFQPQ